MKKSADEQILQASNRPASDPSATREAVSASDRQQRASRSILKRKKRVWAIRAVRSQRTLDRVAVAIEEAAASIQRESAILELLLIKENQIEKEHIDNYARRKKKKLK